MGMGKWVRAIVVSAAWGLALCSPARAALIDESQSVVGDAVFDYSFTAAVSGLITITLSDFVAPVAFDVLSFELDTGAPPAIVTNRSTPLTFAAVANTEYFLTVFAGSGSLEGHAFGKYQLNVSDPVPVPEPAVWLMMLGGIGLLGWMRLRKSESMG